MITNDVLKTAALEFSRNIYDDRLREAGRDISDFAIQLIRKYLPQELIKAIEEHPHTLVSSDMAWFSNNLNTVQVKIERSIYPRLREIHINAEDFQRLANLVNSYHRLNAAIKNMETGVYAILKTLQSYNLIIKHFPEIEPYLTPRVTATESRAYRDDDNNRIRSIIPIINSIREDIQR